MNINTGSRSALKAFFKKQAIPTEGNFAELIDGMINQKDDGLAKLPGSALAVQAESQTAAKKVLDLYQSFGDADPEWTLSLSPLADPNDPASGKPGLSVSDKNKTSRLFIDRGTGNVGVGTLQPTARLHVGGNTTITGDLQVSGNVQVTGTVACEGWKPLTPKNGWVSYGAGYAPPGYCKDSIGFIHLRGIIVNGTKAAGTVLATLPVGYRPEYQSVFPCDYNNPPAHTRVDICTNGDVTLQLAILTTVATGYYISLDSIVFKAFQ